MTGKRAKHSRTVRVNVLAALALTIPGADVWIAQHPRETFWGLIAVNLFLRLVTKDQIAIENPFLQKILKRGRR